MIEFTYVCTLCGHTFCRLQTPQVEAPGACIYSPTDPAVFVYESQADLGDEEAL